MGAIASAQCRREHLVDALTKVAQNVIIVDADAVPGKERGGGATDEHRPRHQILPVTFSRQEPFPVRELFDRRHDEGIVPCAAVPLRSAGSWARVPQ